MAATQTQPSPSALDRYLAEKAKAALDGAGANTIPPSEQQKAPGGGGGLDKYNPWAKSIKELPARKYQPAFDRGDAMAKAKGFDPGAGTDLIRWARLSHVARSTGRDITRVIEESGDLRMKAAFKSLEEMIEQSGPEMKALAESTLVDGGALIPPEFSSEFLFLLRASTVVLESGARVLEMGAPVVNMGRQNAPGTAYYTGETQAVTASQQQFGQLLLNAKKLMALTPFSNDFLRDGGPSAEQKVRDDLVLVAANKQDLTWLRGDGTQGTPKGLLSLVNSAALLSATQAGSAATFQEISTDTASLRAVLKNHNIDKAAPMKTWGWVMHPRSEEYLLAVSSSYGVYPFKDEMEQKGTFRGLPYKTTTAIPINLGGGGNESEVYLCAWPLYYIGMNMPLEVALFPNGTAPDIGGTLVSGIANDMSFLRLVSKHDSQLGYDFAAAVLQHVKWGA